MTQEFYLKNSAVLDALEWASKTDYNLKGKTPLEILNEYYKQTKYQIS